MEILLFLIHKFFIFTFILAILFIVKEAVRFIRALLTNGELTFGKHTLLWLGISLAHIITTLITGFII